ncbi:MAG TPA: ROK family transcriptional regulator, partial [Burkholderiaceae bacterium]
MSAPNKPPGPLLPGTNLEFARAHNRRVVLEAIRVHGRLTRAEVARLTALTPQTISNIAGELLGQGFLTALAPERGTRGQPATPFVINPDGAYSVGLQLDRHRLVAVAVDLSGRVRGRCVLEVERPAPEQAPPLLREALETLRRQADLDWDRVLGLGLAMPGPAGAETLPAAGPASQWQDRLVAPMLGDAIGLPVFMENEATAAAVGERLYGVARDLRSFACLFVGEGLGAGLVQDGRLSRGAGRNAGGIGHMVVVPDGRPCPCGNRGCLARYVSLRAAYEALHVEDPDRADPGCLLDPAPQARARLDAWLDEAARRLRQAVNILESVLDAEAVVVGGFLPSPLLERLVDRLE